MSFLGSDNQKLALIIGINYTGNLDIIRTSPDHGTAYDITNIENVSYSAILNCFKLIKKIQKNRNKSI